MTEFSELQVFQDLQEVVKKYAAAKEASDGSLTSQYQSEMLLHFMAIKKMNSTLALRLQASRDGHANGMEKLDQMKLKSANLEYKREHLLQDILGCKSLVTPNLTKVEGEMKMKLALNAYSENLDDVHNQALDAMNREIVMREQDQLKFALMNKKKELAYARFDKKRKFLEQDIPSKLVRIKEICEELKLDYDEYLAQHEKEQSSVAVGAHTGDGDVDADVDADGDGDGDEPAEEEEEEEEEDAGEEEGGEGAGAVPDMGDDGR